MSDLVNTRQILRELLQRTETGEIRWKIRWEISSDYKSTFVYRKPVTDKKYLIFVLTARLPKEKSDLTILFGEKDNERLVSVITPQTQILIRDLAQELMERFNKGDIQYLRENWGGLKLRGGSTIESPFKIGDRISHKTEGFGTIKEIFSEARNGFPKGTIVIKYDRYGAGSNILGYLRPGELSAIIKVETGHSDSVDSPTDKMKNLKLVKLIIKNTKDGKLTWEDTDYDENSATFMSSHSLTNLKSLTFSVKTNSKDKDKDANILRVLLKRKGSVANTQTTVIRSLRLVDHPYILDLLSLLNKKILSREYISPHKEEPKKSVAVTVNTLDEYREEILKIIRDIIKKFPLNRENEDYLEEVRILYDKCKKAETVEQIGSILYRIKNLEEEAIESDINRYRENYLG